MIENNNPDIDTEQLVARIQAEARQKQPRPRVAPYIPPKVAAASKWKRKLKEVLHFSTWRERIRAIPFAGGFARWIYNLIKLPELKRHLLGRLDFLAGQQEALSHRHEKAAQQQDKFFRGLEQTRGELEQARGELDQTRGELEQTRGELAQQSAWLRQELHHTQRSCRSLSESSNSAATAPSRDLAMSGNGSAMLDRYYLAFENTFRGSREDIKSRLEIYLPCLRQMDIGSVDFPVLDIGCGRGEWLELLKGSGQVAFGIDLNEVMVDLCRERGLDVKRAEVLACLADLPDGRLGAVTGFHIIEHLSFEQLLLLFDETLRVLKPGGIAIFETPNPENLMVGALSFYNDPTHRNPLPPQVVDFMLKQRGFAMTKILRLHPYPDEVQLMENSATAERINQLFYGPQDYAVIATKSHET